MTTKKHFLYLIISISTLFISIGCTSTEDHVRRGVGQKLDSYHLLGITEPINDQRIAVYTGETYDYHTVGYVILEKKRLSWEEGNAGSGNRPKTNTPPSTLVDVHQTVSTHLSKETVIFGEIFSTAVTTLTFDLKDNTVLSIPITEDYFAFKFADANPVMLVHVIDQTGNELEQFSLISSNP